MSLINQMLQDLEQRGSGNLVGSGMPQMVRAAPERRGVHPAWWLVALLTLTLTGVVVWFWLRPPPPPTAIAAFSLKIAPDLSALPSPVAQSSVPLEQGMPAQPAQMVSHDSVAVAPPSMDGRRSDDAANRAGRTEGAASSEPRQESLAKLPASSTKETVLPHAPDAAADEPVKNAKLAKQVKELTPQQHAENAYRQASTALQLGRNADAIADLEQALQLDPQHAAARQMLVGLLLQAKRSDEAVRRAQEGLALDPAQFGLAMILARVQVEQGDLKAALATLEHGLPYAAERSDYQAFLAALLQRDKRHKEAIDHYVAALAKAPQNGVWWMGLGISLQAENRLPEAKEAFNRAKTSNTLTPELLAFVNQKLVQFH